MEEGHNAMDLMSADICIHGQDININNRGHLYNSPSQVFGYLLALRHVIKMGMVKK